MDKGWRSTSIKIFLILFCICILLMAYSFATQEKITGREVAEIYDLPVGQTVFAGDSILQDHDEVKVPLISSFANIVNQIETLDLGGLLISLTTGSVPFDFTTVSSGGIDSLGYAYGFDGPGYLALEGDNLVVNAPDNFVWGYSTPYKVLTKTSEGVDVVENGTVIDSVPENEIKDLDFSNDYYNITTIRGWYNHDSTIGSNFTLEKGISNFSDGRSEINASDIERIFGENITNYVEAYPDGTPIVLYMNDFEEEDGETYYTSLGSHPEYGDSLREYNARQFVDAWNNTIIPGHATGNGKAYIDFGSAADSNAPGGSASHGVCPPARALRTAVLAEGFDLPVGMVYDEDAVAFGYNPSEDIKITNDLDVPVKIVMWTEGSGTGMLLYAQLVRYVPN